MFEINDIIQLENSQTQPTIQKSTYTRIILLQSLNPSSTYFSQSTKSIPTQKLFCTCTL